MQFPEFFCRPVQHQCLLCRNTHIQLRPRKLLKRFPQPLLQLLHYPLQLALWDPGELSAGHTASSESDGGLITPAEADELLPYRVRLHSGGINIAHQHMAGRNESFKQTATC